MNHFVFEDHTRKLCSIYDLRLIHVVYSHWDLHRPPESLLEWTRTEIQNFSKNRSKYENSEHFRDKETKDFLVNQSDNVLLHLKRLKTFLEEGIDKGYKLVVE
jgi:hypothetical protein